MTAPGKAPVRFDVPGPRPHPLFGRIGRILPMLIDPIAAMDRLFADHGPVAALVAGGGTRFYSPKPDCPGTVFVHGADLAQAVLGEPEVFHNSPVSGRLYPQAREVPPRLAPLKHWGAGLFALNGDEHRRHRRLMLPVFQKAHIARYRDLVVRRTRAWLDGLAPGRTIDAHDEFIGLTQAIATEALFGTGAADLARSIASSLQQSLQLLVSPATMFLPFDVPGLPYHRFLDQAADIDKALRQMLAHKRAEPTPADDVLALLLQARGDEGDSLSEDDLIGHMNLLFGAGHETTANALAWTCFLLSQHPEVMAHLHDEIDGALHGDPPSAEQLGALPLLERVVQESLRVLPPVPWLPRLAVRAAEVGGHHLPAGSEVIVSVYHTHRDGTIYPRPGRFDPGRWQGLETSTFEYLAFGAGSHRCLGAGLAMLELKVVLAMVLQRYRLEYVVGRPLNYAVRVTLTPGRGMPMQVHEQDRRWTRFERARGSIRRLVELPD